MFRKLCKNLKLLQRKKLVFGRLFNLYGILQKFSFWTTWQLGQTLLPFRTFFKKKRFLRGNIQYKNKSSELKVAMNLVEESLEK